MSNSSSLKRSGSSTLLSRFTPAKSALSNLGTESADPLLRNKRQKLDDSSPVNSGRRVVSAPTTVSAASEAGGSVSPTVSTVPLPSPASEPETDPEQELARIREKRKRAEEEEEEASDLLAAKKKTSPSPTPGAPSSAPPVKLESGDTLPKKGLSLAGGVSQNKIKLSFGKKLA